MADSPSSQYSSSDVDDLVAYPADPNREGQQEQPEDEEGFFDIDVLIHKLEAYKASVEEAQAQLRRKRSINPREVSEVAAAARKLRLNGRPAASSASYDNSVLTSPNALVFPSSASSNVSSSSEISYFDPITPEDYEETPIEVVPGSTCRDTWKSSHSLPIQYDKNSRYDVPAMPIIPRRSPGRLVREGRASRAPTIRLLSSQSTVTSHLGSPAFAPSDWPDVPRGIGSRTASEYGDGPRKSIDAMSMCPPDEDRIRREIESYTIKDWMDIENVKQLEAIASSKEAGKVQILSSDEKDLKELCTDPSPARYEYRKTTFREKMGSLWNRRTKADKIIELYFDMDPAPK